MLAQTVTTPDTGSYLILGLGVFFGIIGLYIVTLVFRARNLRKDEALVEQLSEDK